MSARKLNPPVKKSPKRILLVEDHPIMREGLCSTINREADMTVCCDVDTAAKAMDAARKGRPDIALIDITLPGKSGLELIKDLKASYPELPVLVLSMHDESLYAERALRAGAAGYVTKQQPPEEVIKAIRQVFGGKVYVSAEMSTTLIQGLSGKRNASAASPMGILTDREFEILQLLGSGKGTKEIADHLHLSPKTVGVHNAHIRQKLNLKTNAQLIRYSVQWQNV